MAVVEDAWNRGDTDDHNVPSLRDSIERSESRPQIFGAYGNPNKQGCWEWIPIGDIAHVDKFYGCTAAAKSP